MSIRRIAVMGAALAAALTLAGCLPFGLFDQATPSSAPTLDGSGEQKYYDQQLAWSSCGDAGIDCTTVIVPLDWNDPDGETIEVAMSRRQASGTSQGSLLINPGGPGGSGYAYGQYADQIFPPAILENFDVIGWDPRGVGLSTPVVCYTDDADQDALLYDTFTAEYGTEPWLAELQAREEDWAKACVDNTGPLLGHIDAGSVARDMDVMRAVLGDDTINYLGYSYGTYLGTVYAELFPEKVGRMVLDGAVDPQVSDLESLTVQMAGFESAFRAFMTNCLAGADCPFTGDLDAALGTVRQVIDTVDDQGLALDDGRVLDRATLGTAIAENLYSEGDWPTMSAMFAQLKAGDASGVFASADSYNGRQADGSYPESLVDVYTAVTCLEGNLGSDGVSPLDGLKQIQAAAPTIGTAIAWDDYAVLDTVCSEWPEPAAQLPTEFDAAGAAPILVIGTSNDPATPYANAVSLSEQLESGVLISYEGEGHTIYAQGVACIDDTVDDYFVNGTVPAADPMC
jgi:pimeloyl-ACP methyl ester carboxylesterase